MSNWELIPADEGTLWDAAVERSGDHDVYHRVPTPLAGGEPWLFHASAGGHAASVPFYVRAIEGIDAVDAISAYGYPGTVTSAERPEPALAAAFQTGLGAAFDELGVVAWFGRQHPLFTSD